MISYPLPVEGVETDSRGEGRVGAGLLQTRICELSPEAKAVFRQQTLVLAQYWLSCRPGEATVHLFPHVRADGDALGAAFAYGRLLSDLGFKPVILAEEPVPEKMAYLQTDRVSIQVRNQTTTEPAPTIQIAVALDCHGADRLESREDLFENAPYKLIIDHHLSQRELNPLYLRDTAAAATCELIGQYFLYLAQVDLKELLRAEMSVTTATSQRQELAGLIRKARGLSLDRETADALLTGLLTDTGRFSYSNTTARTLRTAALAREAGGDIPMLAGRHFDEVSRARYELTGRMVDRTCFAAGGHLAVAWLSKEDLLETGAVEEDTDGLSSKLRDIVGVEAAILIREAESGEWRCSLRSGQAFDVSAFANRHGGGGHKRAAGMTLTEPGLDGADVAQKLLVELEVAWAQ